MRIACIFAVVLAALAAPLSVHAQTIPQPAAVEVVGVQPAVAGLRDTITIELRVPPGADAPGATAGDTLALFLGGREIGGLNGSVETIDAPDGQHHRATFTLMRTEASKDDWAVLLGAPRLADPVRRMPVSIGVAGQPPFPTKASLGLRIFDPVWAFGLLVAVALVGAAVVAWAARTDLLRNPLPSDPPPPDVEPSRPVRGTFSLSRTQMAWWTVLVFASFGFIFLLTGDYDTLTVGTVALLGIAGATALGSTVATAGVAPAVGTGPASPERDQAVAALKQLRQQLADLPTATGAAARAALQAKVAAAEAEVFGSSRGFLRDLLWDGNGVSLHRLQAVLWTVTLGVVFLLEVYRVLGMPDFNATLLALLGISNGTYVGFKLAARG